MNEVMNTQQLPSTSNTVAAPMNNINQGTVVVESSRAMAEAYEQVAKAERCPRDEIAAYKRVIQACQRPKMAEKAFYSYPRGKQTVEGVTIRFAEELALCWGNIDFGIKELSRDENKTELQAYAWDMQSNVRSVQNFVNPHQREAFGKMQTLTSNRDIYENNSNMGARRKRAMILAVLPSWLVDEAIDECKRTLAGNNSIPLIDRINNMVVQFSKLGVTQEQLERRLKRKLDTITPDDFVEYVGIFNAIKNGESKAAEWFEAEKEASDLTAALKGGVVNE